MWGKRIFTSSQMSFCALSLFAGNICDDFSFESFLWCPISVELQYHWTEIKCVFMREFATCSSRFCGWYPTPSSLHLLPPPPPLPPPTFLLSAFLLSANIVRWKREYSPFSLSSTWAPFSPQHITTSSSSLHPYFLHLHDDRRRNSSAVWY